MTGSVAMPESGYPELRSLFCRQTQCSRLAVEDAAAIGDNTLHIRLWRRASSQQGGPPPL